MLTKILCVGVLACIAFGQPDLALITAVATLVVALASKVSR